MKILNLTQHAATPEQVAQGVVEPTDKQSVQALLTFGEQPSADTIHVRARALAKLAKAHGATAAMVGGAPYLMGPLEIELGWEGIQSLYAFSERRSEEQTQADGTVRKINVFRHVGFVGGVVCRAMREHGLSSAQGAVPMEEGV